MNDINLKLIELPSIQDSDAIFFLYCSDRLKISLQEIIVGSVKANREIKISVGLIIPILNRILECSTSTSFLLVKKRIRDSAVLLLCLYELLLDLEYISLQPDRESIWINHNKENIKPWKVDDQLKEIYITNESYSLEKEFYRKLCMIKHGNYAGNELSFNINLRGNRISLNGIGEEYLFTFIFILNRVLYQSGLASLKILENHSILLETEKNKLKEEISYYETNVGKYLSNAVKDYLYKNVPELKDIDIEIKRLKEEQKRLEDEIKSLEL